MKDYDIVLEKLKNFPQFRERRFRGKYLAKLALRELGMETRFEKQMKLEPVNFTLEEMSEFAIKYDSLRHAWGEVLRTHKDLQGSDYEDKKIVVQNKLLQMGYEPTL